jgi:hypothetical protein
MWGISAGLFLLLFFGFIVFVSLSGWYRTKDIEVSVGDQSPTTPGAAQAKSKSKQITKKEFDAVEADQKLSLKDWQKSQDEISLIITNKITTPNKDELVMVNDPTKESTSTLKFVGKSGKEIEISKNTCAGSGLFSPDYSKILLTESAGGLCTKHSVFDLTNNEKKELDSKNTQWLTWVDNNKILYQKFRTSDTLLGGSDLWVEDLSTGDKKQITKDIDIESKIYGKGVEHFPVSPDKNLVAFSNKKGLFLAKLDGTKVTQTADDVCGKYDPLSDLKEGVTLKNYGEVACREIKWSKDSKKLYTHKFELIKNKEGNLITDASKGYWEITLGKI